MTSTSLADSLELLSGDRQTAQRIRECDFFELGLIGVTITSPTNGCLAVNDRICEILGYSRPELLQITWAGMTHPDDLAADVAQFDRILAGEVDRATRSTNAGFARTVAALVVVRVSDDGPGMTEEVKGHCMEPSFSTKGHAVSSGLGLAFVQGIVSEVGGRVEIESTLAHGTTVTW